MSDNNKLVINTPTGFFLLPAPTIIYCKEDHHTCTFYVTGNTVVPSEKSLSFFETKLEDWDFIRINKTLMVNVSHIKNLKQEDQTYLILSDETRIPLTNKGLAKVYDKIFQFKRPKTELAMVD